MEITFEAYDLMQEQLEVLPNQSLTWLPSEDDLKTYVFKKPEKYLEFLIWLTVTVSPTTDEGKARLKAVNQILYEKIIFLD